MPNGGHGAGGQYAVRKRNDFFVQWLLGVTLPDWNAGATDARVGGGGNRGGESNRLEFPLEPQMDAGFYDGPNDPPYVWW